MSYYPQQPTYNYQVPYNSPYQSPYTYPSSSSHNQMPTYYVDSRRSTSRSHSKHNPPVVFQTPSGHQYYPTARDYAYSDGGRRRRASSVGHGGHYSTSYYPPPSRSARSNSHGRSSRDYGTSSSHHRSHSHSRPVYYESSHHGGGYHDGRRPSVSYSDSGYSYSRPHHHSETLGDKFRRWFGGGHGHHDSGKFEYVDARTGRPVDRSGRPIYRV